MKLSYNILWFEDVKSSFEAKKRIVKEIVEELGFDFPEPRNEIDGQNIWSIDYEIYDLIIADLNLAGEKGPELINRIRHREEVYTEVVFYSSSGEKAVRDALKNYEIDGAYCADRNNEDFEDKIRNVIKTTIKKVQDVNNMRGLIMAETSDIDETMLEIVQKIFEKNCFDIRNSLVNEIYNSVHQKFKSKSGEFEKYRKNDRIDKVVADPIMFDSAQKILAVQFIIDAIDHETTIPHKKDAFRTNYSGEVKQRRDLLAHVKERNNDGKLILKSKTKEIIFNDEFCISLRQKVKQHGLTLDNLLNYLCAL